MQPTPSIHPPSHSMSSISPIPPASGSIMTASNGEHLAKINTQLIQVNIEIIVIITMITSMFRMCIV